MSGKVIRLPYERVFAKATPASFGRALDLMHKSILAETEELERQLEAEKLSLIAFTKALEESNL